MQHDKVLILDFGSQVTQLIARRVREASVYCEIHPNDVSDDFIKAFAPKAIILSGSHASTYEDHELRAPQAVWDAGVPVLGICYGMQTMAVQLGGKVEWSDHRKSWSTIGVSDNVIEASWHALVDAIRLELMRLTEQDDSVEKAVEDYCWGV